MAALGEGSSRLKGKRKKKKRKDTNNILTIKKGNSLKNVPIRRPPRFVKRTHIIGGRGKEKKRTLLLTGVKFQRVVIKKY